MVGRIFSESIHIGLSLSPIWTHEVLDTVDENILSCVNTSVGICYVEGDTNYGGATI